MPFPRAGRFLAAAGALVLLAACLPDRRAPTQTIRQIVQPEDASHVTVSIETGSGLVNLRPALTDALFDGEYTLSDERLAPAMTYRVDGGEGFLTLKPDTGSTPRRGAAEWNLGFNPAIPLALDAMLGPGLHSLALGGLSLSGAAIHLQGSGALALDLLGYWPTDASIELTADGPASLSVLLPRGTGVRVELDGPLPADSAALLTPRDGAYVNTAFSTSPVTLTLHVGEGFSKISFSEGVPADKTVGEILEMARIMYSEETWGCATAPDDGQQLAADRVGDLWLDYICERGPEQRTLDGSALLTHELAGSELVDRIRRQFYAEGDIRDEALLEFNTGEFLSATADMLIKLHERDEREFSITHFIGSFTYTVLREGDRVHFTIINQTDRASGTHIPLRFPHGGYTATVESLAASDPALLDTYFFELLLSNRYPLVSVLDAKTRAGTDPEQGEGGGAFIQTFTWTETYQPDFDALEPWPAYVEHLDIR